MRFLPKSFDLQKIKLDLSLNDNILRWISFNIKPPLCLSPTINYCFIHVWHQNVHNNSTKKKYCLTSFCIESLAHMGIDKNDNEYHNFNINIVFIYNNCPPLNCWVSLSPQIKYLNNILYLVFPVWNFTFCLVSTPKIYQVFFKYLTRKYHKRFPFYLLNNLNLCI